MMAVLKTQKNNASIAGFLASVENETRRKDAGKILKLMRELTGEKPFMWGTSIVGFGSYHYKSARSRQEGDWFITGFSPRKTSLTLYLMPSVQQYSELLKKLGKHKASGSCLYINKMEEVDMQVLKELILAAWKTMKEKVAAGKNE